MSEAGGFPTEPDVTDGTDSDDGIARCGARHRDGHACWAHLDHDGSCPNADRHEITSDQQEVESLARTMFDAGHAARMGMVTWDTAPEDIRRLFRDRATAASAWMHERESVETAEELAVLPVGSVVLGSDGRVWEKALGGDYAPFLRAFNGQHERRPGRRLPARVLYRPETREGR